jgi:hypothetical protein
MMDVDDEIAGLEVEEGIDGACALDGAEAAAGAVAVEDFVMADEEKGGRGRGTEPLRH